MKIYSNLLTNMQFTTYHIVKNFKRLILRSKEKTNLEQLSSGFVVEVRKVDTQL